MRLGLTTAAFYGRMETEDAAERLRTFDVDCAGNLFGDIQRVFGCFRCSGTRTVGRTPFDKRAPDGHGL